MKNTKTIYNDDALDKIKTFLAEDLKVDHIITDPPYNISRKDNFTYLGRYGLSFGEWDSGEFNLTSWIEPYSKLIKENGSFIIFCSYKYISEIINCLESSDVGFEVKDILVWEKSNPMPRNVNRRYVQDKEFAIWAVRKGAKWIFNKPKDISYLRSTYKTSTVLGRERLNHPTQKSLKLMEEIIKVHTDENQTILDPFMGTATTGVASFNLNRNFIGVERDKEFFKLAMHRLTEINKVKKTRFL